MNDTNVKEILSRLEAVEKAVKTLKSKIDSLATEVQVVKNSLPHPSY